MVSERLEAYGTVQHEPISIRATYRRLPLPQLERLRFEDPLEALSSVMGLEGIEGCILLQTCNRVEFFLSCTKGKEGLALRALKNYWLGARGIGDEALELSQGREALLHLLELTAGLDSMVVGEDQILGQVKEALRMAERAGSLEPCLKGAFEHSIRVGARIRAETRINRGAVSLASVAMEVARERLKGLGGRRVLLVGAGEVGLSVAKILAKEGARLFVSSRSLDRASALTRVVGGEAIPFTDALTLLPTFELMVVATAAPYLLITREKVERSLAGREAAGKELRLIVDLSNPRNVDPSIKELGLELVTIDELREPAERNLQRRLEKAKRARRLVLEELGRLEELWRRKEAEPLIALLYKEADEVKGRELKRALRRLKGMGEEEKRVMEDLAQALVEGILHTPASRLRSLAEEGRMEALQLAKLLFLREGLHRRA